MTRHEVENTILEQGVKICESIFERATDLLVQQGPVITRSKQYGQSAKNKKGARFYPAPFSWLENVG